MQGDVCAEVLPSHVQVKVDNSALSDMQGGGGFTKSLRYGSQLQLEEVGAPLSIVTECI